MESLRLVLENNTFCFNGKFYHQRKGTAMGTKVAPTYATLVMGYIEDILYRKVHDSMSESIAKHVRETWKRFLDDCFLVWLSTRENLDIFLDIINKLHPSISFTMESSESKIPFLDVLVVKEDTKLKTDIYYKPTDTHQYLQFGSCHPRHTRTNIPYSLARRVCTIVSETDKRDLRLKELMGYLRKLGYPLRVINDAIEKSLKIPRHTLLKPNEKSVGDQIIPFVSTFNPNNCDIMPVIRDNLPILQQSDKMKQGLNKFKIIKSTRQPKNLKQILCPSKYSCTESVPCVSRCNTPRCGTCNIISEGTTFLFANGKGFNVKADMNCRSKDVVYVMRCSGCGENYIGETGME
ncbi:uncharacterized protein LOC125377449, partial [Haliotis rufescens]|uniref:uncharacterized protein LOC125377449 n=1 Tax=Haliotis rufescens TaxID=6454 RepID=UPI00201F9959